MGVALGDVDGDGLVDLFVTHLTDETNTLWKQGPRGLFRDATLVDPAGPAALARHRLRHRDGRLRQRRRPGRGGRQRPRRPRRTGGQPGLGGRSGGPTPSATNSSPTTAAAGFRTFPRTTPRSARRRASAAAWRSATCSTTARWPCSTTEIGGPARLYRNVAADRGHWLEVRAVDPALHRDAYGAEVDGAGRRPALGALDQPRRQLPVQQRPAGPFRPGPGDHVDAVEILWPDGRRETFDGGRRTCGGSCAGARVGPRRKPRERGQKVYKPAAPGLVKRGDRRGRGRLVRLALVHAAGAAGRAAGRRGAGRRPGRRGGA